MATKKEIYEAVTLAVAALGLDEDTNVSLTAIFDEHLAPKSGGASVNIDEVTRKDGDGNIVEILCSVSGVWLPATEEFFYADKSGKGINGLKRVSKQGESVRKKHNKAISASEKAIMQDIIDGAIDATEAKEKLEELKASKPDYSSVTAEPKPEEGEE